MSSGKRVRFDGTPFPVCGACGVDSEWISLRYDPDLGLAHIDGEWGCQTAAKQDAYQKAQRLGLPTVSGERIAEIQNAVKQKWAAIREGQKVICRNCQHWRPMTDSLISGYCFLTEYDGVDRVGVEGEFGVAAQAKDGEGMWAQLETVATFGCNQFTRKPKDESEVSGDK